jgi:hypothetical protein
MTKGKKNVKNKQQDAFVRKTGRGASGQRAFFDAEEDAPETCRDTRFDDPVRAGDPGRVGHPDTHDATFELRRNPADGQHEQSGRHFNSVKTREPLLKGKDKYS